jgi:hypothetical protein
MKKTFLLIFLFFSVNAFSQNPEDPSTNQQPKVKVSPFTAQFLVSTDFEAVCLNLVGAGIRYTKNNSSVSITIFPTLTFREPETVLGGKQKPFVRPGFAVGPLFQYKRLMIGFPIFYQDDAWHFTGGAGLKIGK